MAAIEAVDYEYSNYAHQPKRTIWVKTSYKIWLAYSPVNVYQVDTSLDWWINVACHLESCSFCELIPLAPELFSAPQMSSQCGRIFSQAKRIIIDDCNGLGPEVIEAPKC